MTEPQVLQHRPGVLCVCFWFPPVAVSSGMQRALKFVRYLHDEGWAPAVVSVTPGAYPRLDDSQLHEIPAEVPVLRAFALDATRHLAIAGHYPGWLALPDPWVSWYPGGLRAGLRAIRQLKPSVIWSTSPISTVHLIASSLAKRSGLPWVADFRDPMTMEDYPSDPARRRVARWVERRTVETAAHCVFTAAHTRDMYLERYPGLDARSQVIPNGFDEANFPQDLVDTKRRSARGDRRLRFVHSGAMPADGRSPDGLFRALRILADRGEISEDSFELVLRGCENDDAYRDLATAAGVDGLVRFGSRIPYDEAIREMVEADALLVFQGSVYNHAVPAKLYEYLYARRPIFALLDRAGETARVLAGLGVENVADIDDVPAIAERLGCFARDLRDGTVHVPGEQAIAPYSRRRQATQLSRLLHDVVAEAGRGV